MRVLFYSVSVLLRSKTEDLHYDVNHMQAKLKTEAVDITTQPVQDYHCDIKEKITDEPVTKESDQKESKEEKQKGKSKTKNPFKRLKRAIWKK